MDAGRRRCAIPGLQLIDRLGRRTLMYIGSVGYIVSLGARGWAFLTSHFGFVPLCVFAFIAALVTLSFPVLVSAFPPGYVFLLFMGMMVLQLAWVALQMPETRGMSLEQLQQRLAE